MHKNFIEIVKIMEPMHKSMSKNIPDKYLISIKIQQ